MGKGRQKRLQEHGESEDSLCSSNSDTSHKHTHNFFRLADRPPEHPWTSFWGSSASVWVCETELHCRPATFLQTASLWSCHPLDNSSQTTHTHTHTHTHTEREREGMLNNALRSESCAQMVNIIYNSCSAEYLSVGTAVPGHKGSEDLKYLAAKVERLSLVGMH